MEAGESWFNSRVPDFMKYVFRAHPYQEVDQYAIAEYHTSLIFHWEGGLTIVWGSMSPDMEMKILRNWINIPLCNL